MEVIKYTISPQMQRDVNKVRAEFINHLQVVDTMQLADDRCVLIIKDDTDIKNFTKEIKKCLKVPFTYDLVSY